jgi:hypothetical protein
MSAVIFGDLIGSMLLIIVRYYVSTYKVNIICRRERKYFKGGNQNW